MSAFEAEYLTDEREAALLAVVLVGVDRDEQCADRILCDLIEMGLVHQDTGPLVYRRWQADPELDVPSLVAIYLDADD